MSSRIASIPLGRRGLRQIPHSLVFALVNCVYCLPVLLAYGLGYSEGGVENVLDIDRGQVLRFASVYVGSVVSFHAGAWLIWRFPLYHGSGSGTDQRYVDHLDIRPVKILTVIVCSALVITKILLIPQGVYNGYIFDNDTQIGAVWTSSMFFSESLIPLLFAMLVQQRGVMNPWFIVTFACLCLNLLHGTRIFVTAAGLGVIIYFWLTRPVTRQLAWASAIGVVLIGTLLYLTFSLRAEYQYSEDATAVTIALSPVIYEAVFSQMSLFGYLSNYDLTAIGNPLGFLFDAVSFTLPRFLNPNKDSGGILDAYAYLNPLGAFSGHAAGLIYFGYSMFFCYFLLGAFGSWLQRRARHRPAFFVIYLYFTGDILFRLMRDGYILPFKYLVDGTAVVLIAAWIMPSIRGICPPGTGPTRTARPARTG